MRLQHMQSWVSKWQHAQMYAGVKGGGADAAWIGTALDREEALYEKLGFAAAAIDIWKCFDQILPALIQMLCVLGGMPLRVIGPYSRLMKKIQVVNCLSLGAGKPYRRRCSIPQGCPWSMTMLALITLPWLRLVESTTRAMPRSLADDLFLWVKQLTQDDNTVLDELQRAVECTLQFLCDMGAKPAHKKSLLFASTGAARKILKMLTWGTENHRIPVVLHARDLGAHLNFGSQRIAGTSKGRHQQAASDAQRIGKLPRQLKATERMLITKVMPKALYGCPATAARVQDTRLLASRCADALVGKHQTQRSPEVVAVCAGTGGSDVHTSTLLARWSLLRRAWHAREEWKQQILRLLERWQEDNNLATQQPEAKLKWDKGPIGLLQQSCERLGGHITVEGAIHIPGEQPYNVFTDPINWIRKWLKQRANAAAVANAAKRRDTMSSDALFDNNMHERLNAKRTDRQQRDLLMIQSGAIWTAAGLTKAGLMKDAKCSWCGHHDEDLMHLWWECPHFERHRQRAFELMKHWGPRDLPLGLALHGQPLEPSGDITGPLWRREDCPSGPQRQEQTAATEVTGDLHFAWENCQEDYNNTVEQDEKVPWSKLTCRQMAQWIQGGFGTMPSWTKGVQPCECDQDINLYTDGGVDLNDNMWVAHGSWGLHRPTGTVNDINEELLEVARCEQNEEGVLAYGQAAGPALSSGRMEAMGLYASLAIDGAANVGIDNASVVKRYHKLRKKGPGRKPWGMQHDGDIWCRIEEVMNDRGKDSHKATKVKGHATDADVAQGVVTIAEKEAIVGQIQQSKKVRQ